MISEWLGLSKLLPGTASAAKAVYDRVMETAPRLNFDTTSGGIELHVFNTRGETKILRPSRPRRLYSASPKEKYCATSSGEQRIRSMVQMRIARSPGEKAEIRILRTTLQGNQADQIIRVTARWRTARRGPFPRSTVSISISVRDIRDLLVGVRKQPGIVIV